MKRITVIAALIIAGLLLTSIYLWGHKEPGGDNGHHKPDQVAKIEKLLGVELIPDEGIWHYSPNKEDVNKQKEKSYFEVVYWEKVDKTRVRVCYPLRPDITSTSYDSSPIEKILNSYSPDPSTHTQIIERVKMQAENCRASGGFEKGEPTVFNIPGYKVTVFTGNETNDFVTVDLDAI